MNNKNYFFIAGFVLISLIIIITFKNTDYNVQNENFNSNFQIEEGKVNIYFFWGDGCPHCNNAMEFLNGLEDEYQKLFNLHTFEIYHNSENAELLNEFADILNENINGVPYMIIGDKSFFGYGESLNEDIKNEIINQSKNNYDVHELYKKKINK